MADEIKFTDLTTKKARIQFIRGKLATDKRWVKKALLTIYEYQTLDEQDSRTTAERNNVGFNAFDADILSGMAEYVIAGRTLTDAQYDKVLFKLMPKYAKQLEAISKPSTKK